MRTTLTIDDDIAAFLRQQAKQKGRSFKKVVNDLLRAGVAARGGKPVRRKRIKVVAKAAGLLPGYDPTKFNQLVDQLETEEFLRKYRRDAAT